MLYLTKESITGNLEKGGEMSVTEEGLVGLGAERQLLYPVLVKKWFCANCNQEVFKWQEHHRDFLGNITSIHGKRRNPYDPKISSHMCYGCHEDFHEMMRRIMRLLLINNYLPIRRLIRDICDTIYEVEVFYSLLDNQLGLLRVIPFQNSISSLLELTELGKVAAIVNLGRSK